MKEAKLFSGFDAIKYDDFIKMSKPIRKQLDKGAILTEEGEIVETFAILISGKLKAAKYRYDGTLDLIEIYSEKDIINLDTTCTPTRISPMQISAMEDTEVRLFNRTVLYDDNMPIGISKRLHSNIINILANENIKKMYKIDVLYKKSLRERIMVYLMHMEDRLNKSKFHIRMDREQFAQYLGVNRSALSHELSLMKKEGIIDFKKDYFVILKSIEQD